MPTSLDAPQVKTWVLMILISSQSSETRVSEVAVYIRADIQAKLRPAASEEYFGFPALKVSLETNNSFVLAGKHRPPPAPSPAIDKIADLLSQYSTLGMLILGDFYSSAGLMHPVN